MEATEKSSKNSPFKKLGFGGIGLCALLCSLPIIGGALGLGALTAAAAYFEKIGMAVLILSIGALAFWLYKRKKANFVAPSCDIDCGCKTDAKETIKS